MSEAAGDGGMKRGLEYDVIFISLPNERRGFIVTSV